MGIPVIIARRAYYRDVTSRIASRVIMKKTYSSSTKTLCVIAFVLDIRLTVINGERQAIKIYQANPQMGKETDLALNNVKEKRGVEEEIVGYQLNLLRRSSTQVVQQNVNICVYLLKANVVDLGRNI